MLESRHQGSEDEDAPSNRCLPGEPGQRYEDFRITGSFLVGVGSRVGNGALEHRTGPFSDRCAQRRGPTGDLAQMRIGCALPLVRSMDMKRSLGPYAAAREGSRLLVLRDVRLSVGLSGLGCGWQWPSLDGGDLSAGVAAAGSEYRVLTRYRGSIAWAKIVLRHGSPSARATPC